MFESISRENTRPQFIIELLQPRRLLSLTLEAGGEECDLLPAGDFVDHSLQEPVSDGTVEIADGEEVFEITMLELVDPMPGEQGMPEEWMWLTMMPAEGEVVDYVALPGDESTMPEDWLYMTGVDEEPVGTTDGLAEGEVVILSDPLGNPDEVLQSTGGEVASDNISIAPPPARVATFARFSGLSGSVLNKGDQDLLASPLRVLV
jgi:hypothetical protein